LPSIAAQGENELTTTGATDPAAAGADRFRKAFLLLLVAGITYLFLSVVGPFVITVFLAAIFAGLAYPLYDRLRVGLGGRDRLAALLTLFVLFVGVLIPVAAFLGVVANEALQIGARAQPWLEEQEGWLDEVRVWVERRLPWIQRYLPDGAEMAEQIRDVASRTGMIIMGSLAAVTRSTLNFLLHLFVLLYAFFYFLVGGRTLLRQVLYYVPLGPVEEERLLERFVSVTRATLKGSLLIGVIQGGVAGLAFWVAGVPAPAFWGTIMIVLSIIPAVGASLVWIPAVIYLFLMGQTVAATALLVWCAIVVSSIDNFLRPMLIGRDARMSDLMILLSTLGGIFLFGAVGFIIGPIVAALFVTVWHIYGETFRAWLPEVPAAPVAAVGAPAAVLPKPPAGKVEGVEEDGEGGE
jgi:predicted PurR-regulated permease PerM